MGLSKELSLEQAIEGAVRFSEKYVDRGPYEFFPDKEVVRLVQVGLAENEVKDGYRYCP
jgi:ferredoxin-thioredoxin reductase catalytic subunit